MAEVKDKFPKDWHQKGMDPRWFPKRDDKNNNKNKGKS
jgi:hypothetical protein